MEIEYKNRAEDRQDVIEGNIKNIHQYWHRLNREQRRELLDLSIEQKNYTVLNYFYRIEDTKEKEDDGVTWDYKNQAIIKMAKQGEIELVKYYLIKAYWLNQKVRVEDYIDDLTYAWLSGEKDAWELVPYLDKNKINKANPNAFIVNLLQKGYAISIDNQLSPENKTYQDVLDFFAKIDKTMASSFLNILETAIRYSPNKKTVTNLYQGYIDNPQFLQKMIDDDKSKMTIEEQRQKILNQALEIACNNQQEIAIKELISYGANIREISPGAIRAMLLVSNIESIKLIVEAKISIHHLQEDVLKYHVRTNHVDAAEYLIYHFEDKKKSLEIVQSIKINEQSNLSGIGIQHKQSIKNEIIQYIEKLLFKENLENNLNNDNKTPQRKL